MQFVGFYNLGGDGTEDLVGGSNINVPSFTENVCTNSSMFFSGDFTNLSDKIIHITLYGFSTSITIHKHDIRPYETIKCRMFPLKQIGVHVDSGESIKIHGMGLLFQTTDPDEYAIMCSNAELIEAINIPIFSKNIFNRVIKSAVSTSTLVTPASGKVIALYKVHIHSLGQQDSEIFFTDSANGNEKYIGKVSFGSGGGSYTFDFDQQGLQNPNGANGLLRVTTGYATQTSFYIISTNKESGF